MQTIIVHKVPPLFALQADVPCWARPPRVLLWGQPGYGITAMSRQIVERYLVSFLGSRAIVVPPLKILAQQTIQEWRLLKNDFPTKVEIAPCGGSGLSKALSTLLSEDLLVAHFTAGVRKITREKLYAVGQKTGCYCITHWCKGYHKILTREDAKDIQLAHSMLPDATIYYVGLGVLGTYKIYPGGEIDFIPSDQK